MDGVWAGIAAGDGIIVHFLRHAVYTFADPTWPPELTAHTKKKPRRSGGLKGFEGWRGIRARRRTKTYDEEIGSAPEAEPEGAKASDVKPKGPENDR
jgi:hypothetical protein